MVTRSWWYNSLLFYETKYACDHWLLVQAANIETKIKDTRAFLSSDESQDPEAIRTKVGELQQASLKVFEVAYKKVGRRTIWIVIKCILWDILNSVGWFLEPGQYVI